MRNRVESARARVRFSGGMDMVSAWLWLRKGGNAISAGNCATRARGYPEF